MRILFIYNRVDEALKDKVKRLKEHKAEVSMLSLLEYKLDEDGKSNIIDIDSKLDFLEDKGKLRVLNRVMKRKKLLSYLDDYDIIDLYKCEKSAQFIVNEIADKCYDFFVTPSNDDEPLNFAQKQLYKNLYNKSRFIIFSREEDMDNFEFYDEDKCRLIYNGLPLLQEIDNISQEDVFKASHAMGLDLDKDIIYTDLSSNIQNQLSLIDDIASLKIDKLKKSTFIFYLNQHNLDERNAIKERLEGKNFDYLLIEAIMNDKQKALIYKLTNKSIILSNGDLNPALELSMYAKNRIYLYKNAMIDKLFLDKNFFIQTFEDFKNQNIDESNSLEDDLLTKNQEIIYDIFDGERAIERYIEVIKEV
jgi:hypothetical protein